jgi:hypothetical protein
VHNDPVGTDVARESADMVLADDNFATIVVAVEESKTVSANVKKFVHYLFSCNLSEILTRFIATIAGLPMPLHNPAQRSLHHEQSKIHHQQSKQNAYSASYSTGHEPHEFHSFSLFQSADVSDHLPDLFVGQNTFPGWHGGAFAARGDAPEQIIIANCCA